MLDIITSNHDMKLCQYKMDNQEWVMAQQLCDALKDSYHFVSMLISCLLILTVTFRLVDCHIMLHQSLWTLTQLL